jgi:peptidoglycan/LPS O-acetylase OafA/YrhL
MALSASALFAKPTPTAVRTKPQLVLWEITLPPFVRENREATLSALVLGALFTTLPLRHYLMSPELGSYFGNIVGLVHFTLPGVFEHNPVPQVINSQLWTIPFELECYFLLLSVSAVLRDRRAFVALIVPLSLVATVLAFFFDPVSPI